MSSLLTSSAASHGARADLTECWPSGWCPSHGAGAGTGPPAKGSIQDRARASLSRPMRESLGSSTNRSQRAEGRAEAAVVEPRAQSRSGTSPGGQRGCQGGALDHGTDVARQQGRPGRAGQQQDRQPQPSGIVPARPFHCCAPVASLWLLPGKAATFLRG